MCSALGSLEGASTAASVFGRFARVRDARELEAVPNGASSMNNGKGRTNFPELVDAKEAAQLLRRPPSTLKRWRYDGVGPDWIVEEGKVMYDVAVLREYVRQNTRVSSVRAAGV